MSARAIDGNALSRHLRHEVSQRAATLREHGITPGLAVILVGANTASATYVAMKDKMCGRLGLHSVRIDLPARTSQGELLARINDLNFDRAVHGILVQSPCHMAFCSRVKVQVSVEMTETVSSWSPRQSRAESAGFLSWGQQAKR